MEFAWLSGRRHTVTVMDEWDDDEDAPLDEARVRGIQYLVDNPDQVGRVSGRDPWSDLLMWISRGRWRQRSGRPVVPRLRTPWRDTISGERPPWRMRAAYLHGSDRDEYAFAVDYQVCARCRIGWVEQPYTWPIYQRRGLARAGLAALRAEHPGYAWHTLGGHINGSQPFWDRVGTDVSGGYRQREICPHITIGG